MCTVHTYVFTCAHVFSPLPPGALLACGRSVAAGCRMCAAFAPLESGHVFRGRDERGLRDGAGKRGSGVPVKVVPTGIASRWVPWLLQWCPARSLVSVFVMC